MKPNYSAGIKAFLLSMLSVCSLFMKFFAFSSSIHEFDALPCCLPPRNQVKMRINVCMATREGLTTIFTLCSEIDRKIALSTVFFESMKFPIPFPPLVQRSFEISRLEPENLSYFDNLKFTTRKSEGNEQTRDKIKDFLFLSCCFLC